MRDFIRTKQGLELVTELAISLFFGTILFLLGWLKILDSKELLVSLIIWALITPSPSRWVIAIGDFVRAQKNGNQTEGQDSGCS